MGILRWYKRDPRAALTGMMELTLEERGAYNTILDLIYVHDGALEDRESFIVPWLAVDPRKWRRIRTKLLNLGKLYVHAGCLRNERSDREVSAVQHRVLAAIKANDKRWGTYREIKALDRPVGLLSTPIKIDNLSARTIPFPFKKPPK